MRRRVWEQMGWRCLRLLPRVPCGGDEWTLALRMEGVVAVVSVVQPHLLAMMRWGCDGKAARAAGRGVLLGAQVLWVIDDQTKGKVELLELLVELVVAQLLG